MFEKKKQVKNLFLDNFALPFKDKLVRYKNFRIDRPKMDTKKGLFGYPVTKNRLPISNLAENPFV